MSPISRRTALRTGTVALLAGTAGCSASGSDPPTVDRLVFRSDTGTAEPIRVRKAYAPRDGSVVQSFAVHEAPATGGERVVEADDGPGFYSVHAEAGRHGSAATLAYNSHRADAPGHDLQFEFVVEADGSLYSNVGRAGDDISVPAGG